MNQPNKRIVTIVIAVIVVQAAAAAGFYWLGTQHAPPPAQQASTTPPARQPLYWHDPMFPEKKFDHPGKSPFMDMQLVPVYADSGQDNTGDGAQSGAAVSIAPAMRQNLGIRTAEVKRAPLAQTLAAVGAIAYDEADLALVQARASGYVEKLYVRAPLERVRKGQPLAELYVPDWVAAQEELLTAQRLQASGVAKLVDAARERMRQAGMSEAQIARVAASGKVQPRVTVNAPIAGVVAELGAREGMTFAAGAALFRINGIGTVWLNAEVPESRAADVRPGGAVQARAAAFPDTLFKGKVSAVLPEIDPATRTLKVRVALANPAAELVPGMFATVTFAPAPGGEVLLVPSEAVIQTGTRAVVMLAQGDGFVPAQVVTGAEADGLTEIRSGLTLGQKVVVSGQFLLDSEASLKGVAARGGPVPSEPAAAHGVHP